MYVGLSNGQANVFVRFYNKSLINQARQVHNGIWPLVSWYDTLACLTVKNIFYCACQSLRLDFSVGVFRMLTTESF